MSKVVLFGTGRGASVAHRFLSSDSPHDVVAFTADAEHVTAREYRGLPVVPFEEVERHYPPDAFQMFILLGYQQMNGLRAAKFAAAKAKGYTLPSYVASDIFRVEPIQAGENCFILDNQSISLDVVIGNNVVMWSSNHVGDLTRIGDHAWLTSHVTMAAGVSVGERAFIGIGATISNGVSIGRDAFIGAGVQLSSDVADGVVLVNTQDQPLTVPSKAFMRVMMSRGRL
jgi:sugar O-acyltransferase (sialic acid O-acetyltransferase NeuD family)